MSHGEETFFVSFIVILHIVCVAHLITIMSCGCCKRLMQGDEKYIHEL